VASFTAPAVLAALAAAIRLRTNVAADDEIKVWTGPPAKGEPFPRRGIVFVRVRADVKPIEVKPAPAHSERYRIEGFVAGSSPLIGEDGIVAARTAAASALDEVHQELRGDHTVGGLAQWAVMTTVDWDQGLEQDRGRVCLASFTIEILARI